jgi:hypothetical protein
VSSGKGGGWALNLCLTIHAKKVVVAEIEENQLNAMAPVVETHIYVIAIAIKEQAARD